MKKAIVILALATAFVLAFTAVAGATWRGFTPVRPNEPAMIANPAEGEPNHNPAWTDGAMVPNPDFEGLSGFITFTEARAEMIRNFGVDGAFGPDDAGANIQGTAHGGYVTTTTKCVVCHSAHRATGLEDPNEEGSFAIPGTPVQTIQNQAFLTAGANTCTACHVVWGSQTSRLLVEWGQPNGGPHSAPGRGCTMCHNSGIHGLSNSRFNVMNVFMLGNTRRGGGVHDDEIMSGNRDDQIAAEMQYWTGPVQGPTSGGQPTQVTLMTHPDDITQNVGTGAAWWYNGARTLGPAGTIPTGAGLTGPQFAAARSMATAYTCSEAGCHVTGAFFTLNWGVGFERGLPEVVDAGMGYTETHMVTGHVMPSVRVTGGGNNACGPCHGGSPAGFPTASTTPGARDESRRAFGCDQCHDMVGVATNTTAWPHGNRNIAVYEWLEDGTQLDGRRTTNADGDVIIGANIVGSGNLWMYGGNIARAAVVDNEGTRIDYVGPGLNHSGQDIGDGVAVASFRGPTSENMAFADQRWFVLTNVTRGRYGLPGTGTGLVDGSCLKCHVAIDADSMDALGSVAADAIRHTWNGGPAGPNDEPPANAYGGNILHPTWNGVAPTNSSRLFLYRQELA